MSESSAKQAEDFFIAATMIHWAAGLFAFILSVISWRFAIFGLACWILAGLMFIGIAIDYGPVDEEGDNKS